MVVVGGGIAGLSAAYALSQSDGPPVACTLVEADSRLGGKILTEQADGFVIEGGPDSFLSQKPWGIELCRKLGLEDRLIGTSQKHRKTFVYSKGRLHELPEGLAMGLPTRLGPFLRSGLLSWPGKLRLGAEIFVPRRREESDESLGGFFRRRLGREALERIIEPLMTGIYAGDADQLSIRATFPRFPDMEREHGSLVRSMLGARRRRPALGMGERARWTPFVTLQGGLSELVQALTGRLSAVKVRLGRRVTAVRSCGTAQGYEVLVDGASPLKADAVVLATPAFGAAGLLEPLDATVAGMLGAIPYASTATVTLGFRREGFSHDLDGYGFVIPRIEGRALLASTWSSSKWDHRAPDGSVLIRAYLGGAGREAALERSDQELVELARADLRHVMGVTEEPVMARVFRWPRAMPQYLVGHLDRLAAIEERLARLPGVFVAGAAYRGVGIPDCIRDGLGSAERVRAYFDKGSSRSL
ncbi:MAG: protoporphyrinogen oxidase [Nitrospirota bacterium]